MLPKPLFSGSMFRTARRQKRIRMESVADLIGYEQVQSLYKFEQGIRQIPLEKLAKYAEVLQIPSKVVIDWILEDQKIQLQKSFENTANRRIPSSDI